MPLLKTLKIILPKANNMQQLNVNDELLSRYLRLQDEINTLSIEKRELRKAILKQRDNVDIYNHSIKVVSKKSIDYRGICLKYLNLESVEIYNFINNVDYLYVDKKHPDEIKLEEEKVNIDFDLFVKNEKEKSNIKDENEEFCLGHNGLFIGDLL